METTATAIAVNACSEQIFSQTLRRNVACVCLAMPGDTLCSVHRAMSDGRIAVPVPVPRKARKGK